MWRCWLFAAFVWCCGCVVPVVLLGVVVMVWYDVLLPDGGIVVFVLRFACCLSCCGGNGRRRRWCIRRVSLVLARLSGEASVCGLG